MTFISYAQNFEDVILWRALKHVENGSYVDIGAQDPVVDSVSRAFYEQGWRGVHVEPVPHYAERLRGDRPDEIVLQAALGASDGTVALNIIPDTGLSTAIDATAQRHHAAGHETQRVHVPMLTLKSAFSMLEGREIHWLKIDVEGFEEQVLRGWDSTQLRPWVLVIEATVPGSAETDYAGWDPIVLAGGYRFVYFDGLNRFYVADEHPELVPAFGAPPNVFDDVQLSGKGSWGLYRQAVAQQQAALAAALEEAHAARQAAEAAQAERDALRAPYDALVASIASLDGRSVAASNALRIQCDAMTAERDAVRRQYELAVARLAEVESAARAEGDELRLRHDEQAADIAGLQAALRAEQALRERHEALAARFASLEAEAAQLRRENEESRTRIAEAHAQTHEWWSVADRLSGENKALYASTSWRVTAPLRRLKRLGSGLFGLPSRGAHLVNRGVRATARPVVVWGLRTVLARPGMRADAARMLERHPGLKNRLRGLALRAGLLHGPAAAPAPAVERGPAPDLAPRAVRFYSQLKHNRHIEKS